jgi:hypothetical protein
MTFADLRDQLHHPDPEVHSRAIQQPAAVDRADRDRDLIK